MSEIVNDIEQNTGEKQEAGLEELFGQLEELIGDMQSGEKTLEETFAGYKKGLELVEKCNKKIEKIECDIKLLNPDGE